MQLDVVLTESWKVGCYRKLLGLLHSETTVSVVKLSGDTPSKATARYTDAGGWLTQGRDELALATAGLTRQTGHAQGATSCLSRTVTHLTVETTQGYKTRGQSSAVQTRAQRRTSITSIRGTRMPSAARLQRFACLWRTGPKNGEKKSDWSAKSWRAMASEMKSP